MTTLTDFHAADRSSEYAPWARKRRVVVLPNPLAMVDTVMAASLRAYPIALVNVALVTFAGLAAAILLVIARHGS
jgi:hypothetical protein